MKSRQTVQAKTLMKPNLALVTLPLPLHNKAGQVSLTNFVELLESLSGNIYLITGNFDDKFQNKNVLVTNGSYDTRNCTMPVKMSKYLLMQVRTALNLLKILRRENIHLVIFFIGGSLIIPLFLTKLLRKKILIVATGSQWRSAVHSGPRGILLSRILKFAESINFSLADSISVESKSVKDFLGLDRYRQKVLYYFGARFVDTNLFNIVRKPSQKDDSIGYVGRLSAEKGILNLVAAMPGVLKVRADVHFSIVGDGPLFSEIENFVREMKERQKVEIKRWVPHERLPAIYDDFKLIIVPSYTEGVPAVVQEAMACGTIVLATATGGIPDLIEDNKTGFILSNNNPKCIVERIIEVLSHPNLDEIAISARELLIKQYSYEALLKKSRIALAWACRI